MCGSIRETLTDIKGNEPMSKSNITIALEVIEMIESGIHSRAHCGVFSTLMGRLNGDRERTGQVLRCIENELDFHLISLLEMGGY